MDLGQIATMIFSTITASLATYSAFVARNARRDAKRIYELSPKRKVLARLVGSLHFATPGLRQHVQAQELAAAINEAIIIFGDDESVRENLQDLKRHLSDEYIVPLVRAMAAASEVDLTGYDDEFLKAPFSM